MPKMRLLTRAFSSAAQIRPLLSQPVAPRPRPVGRGP